MVDYPKRKTIFIMALAATLVASLIAIVLDDDMRERLGTRYYVLSLSIIGCVLLVLAGYVWDQTLQARLKHLRKTIPTAPDDTTDHDDIIGLARNIERMAQALQQSEASYRGIVEDQVDLICRYRPEGTLTFANRAYAEAVGRKRAELIGQRFVHLAPLEAVEGQAPVQEHEVQYADGTKHWLHWTVRPIHDRDGRLLEYQAVGHDFTARKEAEAAAMKAKEAAEAADRAKSEFLAIVSHEIRTPINGVLGFAQTLADTPLNEDQREQVAIIKSSALALEKLISDILDLSKIEAGRLDIEHAPFALHHCIEDTMAFFLPKARAAALTMSAHIHPDVPQVVTSDEARLRQVLNNVIGNALKFTECGGIELRVSCGRVEPGANGARQRPLRLYFAVTDTGVGIPAEKLSHLFKPFSQVDTSSDRRRGGTGLGLIISKRLCELMGGTISVESEVGRGTTFHFSILAQYERGQSAAPFSLGTERAPHG
ncbi:ATP-binding protein [Opitutus sp. ER46]|uniref:PAS domain-containing sensor histidine kinase n=1 Tax=Opitutus sp. ER46 TaxID=2161864 RepID=UPI000D3269D0|nr:ATP-binding protein [Opitutus sp. ER46]PTX94248.1 hypothetical protein DB354_10810 [Opitutus sp. ER46]